VFLDDRFIVWGFRRELLFMGSRGDMSQREVALWFTNSITGRRFKVAVSSYD
jgi:hypothetical protein